MHVGTCHSIIREFATLLDRRLATILSMTHCPSDRKIDPKDVTTVGGRQEVWQIWPWGEAMIFRT